jgi:hypothetical protein
VFLSFINLQSGSDTCQDKEKYNKVYIHGVACILGAGFPPSSCRDGNSRAHPVAESDLFSWFLCVED